MKESYKLAAKNYQTSLSHYNFNGRKIGKGNCMIIAGPCSIESAPQMLAIAQHVSQAGATVLRGGAFKPRTSPYAFQGLGEPALKYMRQAAEQYNLLCVSEVMSREQLPLLEAYVDILQIGARNMQNFDLLKAVGNSRKPVVLKRGFAATYQEFLLAAEYILEGGNSQVILCERGIRTFETGSRNTLDLAAIPILRELTHLPIIIDPSHGTGLRHAVAPMAKAALAAGADGLMIEVHTEPDQSISDADQTISTTMFAHLMQELRELSRVMKIKLTQPSIATGVI
ncbi:MAG: 3-deoxy-7-phosphoheptulonate synthase [Gammaproteobacteria bacterium]